MDQIKDAERVPELAVLSALAHGNQPGGLEVVVAALAGAATLDSERLTLYADLVMASLGEAITRELEALVTSGKYEYQSDFAKKYFAQGRAEGEARGEAKALLRILAGRGWTVSDETRDRILACDDTTQLERRIDAALRADTLDAALADSAQP